MKTLKTGDRGKEVLDIQGRLRALGYDVGTDGVDGLFAEDTRRAVQLYQQRNGLLADGIVGENTWCELVESKYEPGERLLYLRIPPFRGADVIELQRSLNCLGFNAGPEDGIFGSITERAVLDFQKNAGLIMDGMVDDSVLRVMGKVTKDGEPHSDEGKIPDRDGGYLSGRAMSGLKFALDAGHGGKDTGAIGQGGFLEKDLSLRITDGLARLLEAAGAQTVRTREEDLEVPLYERPAAANHAEADVCVSIHLNSSKSGPAQGAAAYYFHRQGYYSERGRTLAEHIVASVSDRLQIKALPVMGRNYTILRETEMATVMVEPFFITADGMPERLKQEGFLVDVSEAIFEGIREYFAS